MFSHEEVLFEAKLICILLYNILRKYCLFKNTLYTRIYETSSSIITLWYIVIEPGIYSVTSLNVLPTILLRYCRYITLYIATIALFG